MSDMFASLKLFITENQIHLQFLLEASNIAEGLLHPH